MCVYVYVYKKIKVIFLFRGQKRRFYVISYISELIACSYELINMQCLYDYNTTNSYLLS